MSFAVTPGDYVVQVELERDDGSRYWRTEEVAAFSDDGVPLVVSIYDKRGLVSVRSSSDLRVCRWRLSRCEGGRPVPAAPGWYALFSLRCDDDGPGDSPTLFRRPVIAWRPSTNEYAGGATIIDYSHSDGEGPRPVDAKALADADEEHLTLLGFFHDRWFPPEPDQADANRGGFAAHEPDLAVASGDES
jgi:hypothetical protein